MRRFEAIRVVAITASLVIANFAARVDAISIPILNNSFESPSVPGTYLVGPPTDWQVSAGLADEFVEDIAAVGMTGGDGTQYAGMDTAGGYIYQDLGVPFQANKTYRIDLASAHRDGFSHNTVQFGLFSSNAIGTDLGTAGFMDIQGVWSGSGNPDGDNMFSVFREASDLQKIDTNHDGIESLGHVYKFTTGPTPPTGNVVVYIRDTGDLRINFDNVRLDASTPVKSGDVDLDGDVDLVDLAAIQTHFRTSVASRGLGDLDEDGFVDFTDYLEWKANFPSPAAGAVAGGSVPEPTAVVLIFTASLLALRRGRRS